MLNLISDAFPNIAIDLAPFKVAGLQVGIEVVFYVDCKKGVYCTCRIALQVVNLKVSEKRIDTAKGS
jgi:hypothetical protein